MKIEITPEIIVSIISFIGVLTSIYFSKKSSNNAIKAENERLEKSIRNEINQNNRALSLQYITNKRIDWIYAVREEMSEFVSVAHYIAERYVVSSDDADKKIHLKDSKDINKSVAKLRLLFNFIGKYDQEILCLIDRIVQNLSLGEKEFQATVFQTDIIRLTQKTQIYLKLEWERVKLETTEFLTKDELEKILETKLKNLIAETKKL